MKYASNIKGQTWAEGLKINLLPQVFPLISKSQKSQIDKISFTSAVKYSSFRL